MHSDTATLSDASFAQGPTHSLQASAVTLASDPVSNISVLPQLQSILESTEVGRHQLQTIAACVAGVLSCTVVSCKGTKIRLDGCALRAMVANAPDNCHSSHRESAEQSRVGLAMLLLGVWAEKLPARLAFAHAKVPEADEDVDFSSDQLATNELSALPVLINVSPADAAADAAGAVNIPSSFGAPASASASAAKSTYYDEVPPQSPCSASIVAASQSLPCSLDHMSMMASDLDEEEEERQHEWVPDFLGPDAHSHCSHMSTDTMLCH